MAARLLISFTLFWLLLPVSQAEEQVAVSAGRDVITGQALLQMFLGLGLVVAVILLMAWLLRKVTSYQSGHKQMQVVASLPLGTRERAVLVQVGERQVLLGVSPGRVSYLESYDEPVIEASKNEFAVSLKRAMKDEKGS